MGWHIDLDVNTVHITDECAADLFVVGSNENPWYAADEVAYNGELQFIYDHMEHMDYLSHRDDILAVLLKHKVNGDICFSSSDGDNRGSKWGYRFTNGVCTELKGKTNWS